MADGLHQLNIMGTDCKQALVLIVCLSGFGTQLKEQCCHFQNVRRRGACQILTGT